MIFKKLILLSFLLLTACGGEGGGTSVTEGIQVTFQLSHQQSIDTTGNTLELPAGQKTFKTREGVTVTLKQAYLVVWSARLESDCNNVNFARSFFNWIATADAHTDTTPTQLGIPNIINLLANDADVVNLGSIYPAPATYCGVTMELLKADEDAVGLLDFPINMLNRVLYIEGEYIPLGTTTQIAFTLDVAKAPRPKSLQLPLPIILSATTPMANVQLITHYDKWFDAVDFTLLDQDAQIDWILNNITQSFIIKAK
ncbi:MAG: hypothetical protein R3E08_05000 [Thiotrichaceae bacterium]